MLAWPLQCWHLCIDGSVCSSWLTLQSSNYQVLECTALKLCDPVALEWCSARFAQLDLHYV